MTALSMYPSLAKRSLAIAILLILAGPVRGEVVASLGLADAIECTESSYATALGNVRELLQTGDIDSAREQLDAMSATISDAPHPSVHVCRLLIESGDVSTGRRMLESLPLVESLDYEVSYAFTSLAVIERRWFDGLVLVERTQSLAIPDRWSSRYQSIVHADLAYLKGVCCEGRNDWEAAANAYRNVLQTFAESKLAIAGSARAEFHLRHIEASFAQFKRLCEVEPTALPPEVQIAQLYDAMGDAAQTERWFRQSLATASQDSSATSQRAAAQLAFARWLIWNNRPDEVRSVMSETPVPVELEAERAYLAALVARMERRFDVAQRILSKLHRQTPADLLVGNQLALVLIECDDEASRARSLQIAETNVRNHPQLSETWSTLGWIQYRLGDSSKATESLAVAARSGVVSRDTAYFISQLQAQINPVNKNESLKQAITQAKGPFFYSQ